MKRFYIFLPSFILTASMMYAQTSTGSPRSKVSEQKEIKATNHLKKEIERKQLTVPPQRIADTAASCQPAPKRKKKM